jgi:hypothetical protein
MLQADTSSYGTFLVTSGARLIPGPNSMFFAPGNYDFAEENWPVVYRPPAQAPEEEIQIQGVATAENNITSTDPLGNAVTFKTEQAVFVGYEIVEDKYAEN